MRLTRTLLSRVAPPLLRKTPFPIPKPGPFLPATEQVDEEIIPGYKSKDFYPAKPGEVLADRYQTIVKVGWGGSSTVWFARDLHRLPDEPEEVVALKINNSNCHSDLERDMEEHIATADSSHPGRSLFRTFKDCFEIPGPSGKHFCFAYEPMRESLRLYRRRFHNDAIPLPLVKIYLKVLLTGLDYLHTKCKVAHMDIHYENIMVSFEDEAVLGDFMNAQFDEPMSYKLDSAGRVVYSRHNEFGSLRRLGSIPQFVDLGSAERFETDGEIGIFPVQPDHARAPEIILGCGYKMSADIWSLGVMLWDLVEGRNLFSQFRDEHGNYSAKAHLAEMIALLGPPPAELLERYQHWRGFKFPEKIRARTGPLFESAEEFFQGPFFSEDGQFLYQDLIPGRKLSDTLPSLDETEQAEFLSFVKLMLTWNPVDRKTAGELAKHPYLN
ncbi:putative protein kinase [Aspergillus undulatus]|uniref:putative protein kinase n=1 Tax=Aspergillus undulatus TaxID=1810928 RepID=UPI003CCD4758